MQVRQIFAAAVAVAAVAVSGLAFAQAARTPTEAVDYRHQQFRRIGATFKALRDGAGASQPDLAALRTNTQTLSQLAQDLPNWFPAGSGPESGARTGAKAEIWSNPTGFAEQARLFREATQQLASATTTDAIGGQVRGLGQRCGGCHSNFREQQQ